jgi:hypothetical protein
MMRARGLVLAAAIGIALLGAAAFYVQTEDGLRRVVAPLAGRALGAEIEVAGGRLTFDGRLRVRELVYREPGLRIRIERGRVHADFGSLAFGPRPHLRALEVEGAEISIEAGEQSADAETPAAAGAPDFAIPAFSVPWRVDRLSVEGATLRLLRDGVPRAVVGPARWTATDVAPAATARSEITTPLAFGPEDSDGGYSGDLQLRAEVALDAAEVFHGASGSGWLSLRTPGQAEPVRNDLVLSQQRDAAGTRLHVDSTASRAGETLAHIELRASQTPVGERRVQLALEQVESGVLNVALALFGPERLAAGRLDATLSAQAPAAAGPLAFDAQASGRGLRLTTQTHLGADADARVSGSWHPKDGRLDLETLVLSHREGGRTRFEAALAQPVSFQLGGEAPDDSPDALRHAAVSIHTDRLELSNFHRIARALGRPLLIPLESGALDADLALEIEDLGERIALRGAGTLHDAALDPRILGRSSGRFVVHAKIDATIESLERLHLASQRLTLEQDGVRLGIWELRGWHDWSAGASEGELSLEVPRLGELLRRLGAPIPRSADPDVALHIGGPVSLDHAAEPSATTFSLRATSGPDSLELEGTSYAEDPLRVVASGTARRIEPSRYADLAPRSAAPAAPPTLPGPTPPEPVAGRALPFDLELDLTLVELRHRGLTAGPGRLHVAGRGHELRSQLSSLELAGGHVRGSIERGFDPSDRRDALRVHADGVALETLLASLLAAPPDATGVIQLDIDVRGHPTPEQTRLEALSGRVGLTISGGRLVASRLSEALSGELGGRLDPLEFDRVDATLRVADGLAEIELLELTGNAARVAVTGRIGLDGRVDLVGEPRLRSRDWFDFVAWLRRQGLPGHAMQRVGDMWVLPVVVVATGPITDPQIESRPAPERALEGAAGAVVDTARDAAEGAGRALEGLIEDPQWLLGSESEEE